MTAPPVEAEAAEPQGHQSSKKQATLPLQFQNNATTVINISYQCFTYRDIETNYLSPDQPLTPGTLCWVLRGRRAKTKRHDNSEQQQVRKTPFNRAWVEEEQGEEGATCTTHNTSATHEEEDRVLVRYPLGSTYRVKRMNLLPVLQEKNQIVVLEDTLMYRRWAAVHTQPNDSFCEIGCDIGILVHRVWQTSSCPDRICGLDTDAKRIRQAKKRYPKCTFLQWKVPLNKINSNSNNKDDTFGGRDQAENNSVESTEKDEDQKRNEKEEESQIKCKNQRQSPSSPPLPMNLFPMPDQNQQSNDNLVVAIDINGNRELQDVKQCIQLVIQEWKPRLIIVKSTAVYAELEKRRKEQTSC